METSGEPVRQPADALDDAAVEDALELLGDLSAWRLPSPRWERADALIASLAQAFAAGDAGLFRDLTTELLRAGPVRITPIGTGPTVPLPDAVRERADRLAHLLRSEASSPVKPPSRDSDVKKDGPSRSR